MRSPTAAELAALRIAAKDEPPGGLAGEYLAHVQAMLDATSHWRAYSRSVGPSRFGFTADDFAERRAFISPAMVGVMHSESRKRVALVFTGSPALGWRLLEGIDAAEFQRMVRGLRMLVGEHLSPERANA